MHILRRPGRMAGPGDPDEVVEAPKNDRFPAIVSHVANPDVERMLASGYVQTESHIMLRSSFDGSPLAYV
jgi:hypothetical protein